MSCCGDSCKKSQAEVTISVEYYEVLLADQAFLECLQSCGVDNWDGYSDAQEMFEECAE